MMRAGRCPRIIRRVPGRVSGWILTAGGGCSSRGTRPDPDRGPPVMREMMRDPDDAPGLSGPARHRRRCATAVGAGTPPTGATG